MDCTQVLAKLAEIERAIGAADSLALRRMVIELQDYIIQSQKESIEVLRQRAGRTAESKRKEER